MRQLHLARSSGNVYVIANTQLSLLPYRRKSKNVELGKTDMRECLPVDDEGLDRSHSSTLNSCTDQLSLVFIFSSPTGRRNTEVLSCRQLPRCQIHSSGRTYLMLSFKSSQSRGQRHSWPAILTYAEVRSDKLHLRALFFSSHLKPIKNS